MAWTAAMAAANRSAWGPQTGATALPLAWCQGCIVASIATRRARRTFPGLAPRLPNDVGAASGTCPGCRPASPVVAEGTVWLDLAEGSLTDCEISLPIPARADHGCPM